MKFTAFVFTLLILVTGCELDPIDSHPAGDSTVVYGGYVQTFCHEGYRFMWMRVSTAGGLVQLKDAAGIPQLCK